MNFRSINLGSRPLTIGIIFGVILTIVLVLYGFIASFLDQTLGSIGLFVGIAIYFGFGFVAGRRASILTGKFSSGIVAGALVGLVSSLLTVVYEMVILFLNIDSYVQQAQIQANKQHLNIHVTTSYLIQNELVYLAQTLLFSFLLVLIGGVMGSFLGRRRALSMAAAEEASNEVITTTAEVKPVEEDEEETPTSASSYNGNGNGATRRSAASRRSRNARRNRNTN